MSMGKVLRYYRKKKGYKQKEIAKYMGISPEHYYKMENGYIKKIRLLYIVRAGQVLGFGVEEFYKKVEELEAG